uniref:Uncharacterized protein n=1 Tax=Arundo donax TaxID=35708 RepID=A0A0A9FJC8_ARUDO
MIHMRCFSTYFCCLICCIWLDTFVCLVNMHVSAHTFTVSNYWIAIQYPFCLSFEFAVQNTWKLMHWGVSVLWIVDDNFAYPKKLYVAL